MGGLLYPGEFCGQLERRLETAGLLLTEHYYSPGLQLPGHAHENAYFCLLLEGSYSETYGYRGRDCSPLSLIYHPAGEVHADSFREAGGRIFNIEAGAQFWSRVAEHHDQFTIPADFKGGPLPSLALRMHREFHAVDDVSPLMMEGLALQMLAELSRSTGRISPGRPPAWLGRVLDLIQARFTENLQIEQLAREIDVHPGHLARVFRQHRRCSIGEFVRQLRIQFACRLLTGSDMALSEIALAAGFADQPHFSRTFRRQVGRTPAEYRREFKPR